MTTMNDTILHTIAVESLSHLEYARRAEAYNSTLAAPHTDGELVTALLDCDTRRVSIFPTGETADERASFRRGMLRHIATARRARIRGARTLWTTLKTGLSREDAL